MPFYESAAGEAVVSAVLSPLLDQRVLFTAATNAEKTVEALRRTRADVLCELLQPPPGAAFYLRNCPTPWRTLSANLKACRRPQLCPWCWARSYVLRIYDAMVGLLWGDEPAKPVSLLRFRTVYKIKPKAALFYEHAVETALTMIAEWISKERRSEVEFFQASRGCVLHRIFITEKSISLVRTGLLVAAAREGFPALEDVLKQKAGIVTCGTRSELARQVAGISRIPKNLLRFPPELAGLVLSKLRHVRMLSVFGASLKSGFEETHGKEKVVGSVDQ